MRSPEAESLKVTPARRGRPPGGSVLWDSVRRLGKEPEEIRDLIVGKLIDAAGQGEEFALRILSDRVLPASRTLDNVDIFQGCETPEQYAAAVLGAVAAGAISPSEAKSLNDAIAAYGNTGEWAEVRRIHRMLAARGTTGLPPLPAPVAALPEPIDPFS